jgi:hypothetical protein
MVIKTWGKEELWCSVVGGAALATGGGGAAMPREAFDRQVDPLIEKGVKFQTVPPKEIPKGELIFIRAGIGGGVDRSMQERCLRSFGVADWIKEMDKVFPISNWAEIPDANWMTVPYRRMVELKGKEPFGYMPFELGPGVAFEIVRAAADGKVLVDADNTGYRAVPETSLGTLNVVQAPIGPMVVTTSWGDLMVFEKFLSYQRAEDLVRHIAETSGGNCNGMMCFDEEWIKKGAVQGSASLAAKVGKAILNAREKGDDPVAAILKAAGGHKLFEGKIGGYTREGLRAFIWGNAWIKGTGDYAGHTLKLWYKNENQITWIDEKPYVTCPDPFTVVDTKTGEGLSNFRPDAWTTGREVTLWGMKCADLWRTERGLRIYNPKHFGFDMPYVPIEKKVK